MLKLAIGLDIALIVIVGIWVKLSLLDGNAFGLSDWMLPFFGIVLLLFLVDTARHRARTK